METKKASLVKSKTRKAKKPAIPKLNKLNVEELRLCYSEQQEWGRHFNQLIWAITGIFLPVAFGGLLFEFTDSKNNVQESSLLSVAVVSIALLWFWRAICDRHRKLWQVRFRTVEAIEAIWGFNVPTSPDQKEPEIDDENPNMEHEEKEEVKTSRPSMGFIEKIRLLFALGGSTLWVLKVAIDMGWIAL